MIYNGLSDFIKVLESNNELIRIKEFVNPEFEIAEITDRISKSKNQNKALLFENTGTSYPLLINAYGNEKRMGLALHSEHISSVENEINITIEKFLKPPSSLKDKISILSLLRKLSSSFPSISGKKAPCQEIVMKDPDLSKLPVLTCWPHDGGAFITLPVVNTKDPVTGVRNAGMYRMQVKGKKETGMHWHLHKTGARHFDEYLKQKKKIPVAVILGGDPVYAYCASAPLPDGIDEYILAGFLRKKKVTLVKCLTQDIEVPSDADFVIEGYVDPSEPLQTEGPFGDHTGFYSLPDKYPLFHVTCITHRRNAIYPATIVGIPPQEDYWLIKASERIFLPLMQKAGLPEVININMPDFGVAHNLVIVQIKNQYPGQAHKVAHALWGMGQMMLNKVLVITDIDPFNLQAIWDRMLKSDVTKNFLFSTGPMDALEHSTDIFAFGGKLAIDITLSVENPGEEVKIADINNVTDLLKECPGIVHLNRSLLGKGIWLITAKENPLEKITGYLNKLSDISILPRFVVFCDQGLDIYNSNLVLWSILANTDPVRDIKKIKAGNVTVLLINGMSKPSGNKSWPNPVYSSKNTIEKINSVWSSIGFEAFEESPSQVIHNMIVNDGFERRIHEN